MKKKIEFLNEELKRKFHVIRILFIYIESIMAWFVLYYIFLGCWIKGGNATISIKMFGEALFEFFFIPIVLILLIIFIVIELRRE